MYFRSNTYLNIPPGSSFHFLSGSVSGFVIVGEDNTGKLDLGIFIASIVPDGPADKDGRIKPGTKHRTTTRNMFTAQHAT